MKWTRQLTQTCAVILALGSQVPLHAAAISIISSSVTVQGMAGSNTYNPFTNPPVPWANSGNTTGTTEDGSIWSATSSGAITTTGATLSAVSQLLDGPGNNFIGAGYSQVSLVSVFQPLISDITFIFTGSTSDHFYESYVNYSLKDLTTEAILETALWSYDYGWQQDELPYTSNLTLVVNRQYQLELFARSTIGDFRQGHANLNLQIVPEPAPACLLAIALAGMVFRRIR